MQEPGMIDPRDSELIDVLKQLQPASLRTSTEQIWYRAGLEAGRRRANVWKGATVLMMVAVGVMLLLRPMRGTPERTVVVQQTTTPATAVVMESDEERASAEAYFRLRDAIAQDGLAALPRVEDGNRGSAPPERRGWPFEF